MQASEALAGAAGGWVLAWAVALLVPATIAASTLSAMIERSGPIRLRHWAEEAEGRLRRLYEQPMRFEAFRLILSVLAKLVPVALFVCLVGFLAATRIAASATAASLWTALAVLLVVGATEVLNRVLVGWDPERTLERLTGVYRGLLVALGPLVALTVWIVPAGGMRRRVEEEEDEVSEDEIEAFIDVGTREGILEPGEEELVWGIVDFGDTAVRSVMTPRIQVHCAPVTADLEELADVFVETGHSRLPLFEGSIDHIVGLLHLRDLLRALRNPGGGERPTPRQLVNPPFFVPETKPLGQLLKELQARHQQMAVVVDEYGGTAGIVTVEDLVEEIVGELVDEHEEAHQANQLLPDGAWLLGGGESVEALEELFGIDLGDDVPWETVGGMVFSLLGDVPKVGESVESLGLRYTVAQVEERRVARVRVEAVVPPADTGAGSPAASEEGA